MVHCPDPIWRVLASSQGISSWTPLKPQHSKPNPNPLANQLCCSDFLTPRTPLIIVTDSLTSMNLLCHSKTDARFMQDARKAVWSVPYVSVAFFQSLKQKSIAYRSSNVSSRQNCIYEIHQLWQSGFSRVYSSSFRSCSFEAEILKIGQSSHKMYSNNILNFREFSTILNAYTKKKVRNLIEFTTHIYIYIYIYTTSSTRPGCDTRLIFNQSWESFFFKTSCHAKVKELSLLFY